MSDYSHSDEHASENGTNLDKDNLVSDHHSHKVQSDSENGPNHKIEESHCVTHEAMDDIFSGLTDSVKRRSHNMEHSNPSMKLNINQILYEFDHPSEDSAAHTHIHKNNNMVMLNRPHIIVFAGILIFIVIFASLMISHNKESGRKSTSENMESAVNSTESRIVQKDTSKAVHSESQKELTNKNTPPQINSADIIPVILGTGTVMEVKASASDVEGDDIKFDYEWSINGEYAGKESEITGPLKRGDSIQLKMSPYDDVDNGLPIVLTKDIHNTPPQILGGKSILNESLYSYQLEAIDNDHDTLTYALISAPEGMTIDSSGQITWTVPPEFKGTVNLTVAIDDGHGGKATQLLTLSIKDSETP
jgi:hypothetical protein